MRLLLGSADPTLDRDQFYRSQVLFWLLAAIDGHAKNFSIFIEPEGKYRLTPLYDIMSAYPLIAKKQLQPQKIKMAMALKGKNTHYHWHTMQRRYFLETAKSVNYSIEKNGCSVSGLHKCNAKNVPYQNECNVSLSNMECREINKNGVGTNYRSGLN